MARRLSFEERRALVMSVIEDGRSQNDTAALFGVNIHTVKRWIAAYRHHGDDGLRDPELEPRPARVPIKVLSKPTAVLVGAAVLAGAEVNASIREARHALLAGQVGTAYRSLETADASLSTLQHTLRRMEPRKDTIP